MTPEEYQRLRDLQPGVVGLCEQLASAGLPETLTHEEVHDGNVLVNDGRYIFIDWSDSSVAHPFFTMLVTIRAAAHRLELAEDGPEMMHLRDAYLEPWTTFATRPTLLAAFRAGLSLGNGQPRLILAIRNGNRWRPTTSSRMPTPYLVGCRIF